MSSLLLKSIFKCLDFDSSASVKSNQEILYVNRPDLPRLNTSLFSFSNSLSASRIRFSPCLWSIAVITLLAVHLLSSWLIIARISNFALPKNLFLIFILLSIIISINLVNVKYSHSEARDAWETILKARHKRLHAWDAWHSYKSTVKLLGTISKIPCLNRKKSPCIGNGTFWESSFMQFHELHYKFNENNKFFTLSLMRITKARHKSSFLIILIVKLVTLIKLYYVKYFLHNVRLNFYERV